MPPLPHVYTPAPVEAAWTAAKPLLEVSLEEYDRLGGELDELYRLLTQCDQEIDRLNHRKTIETANVRQMEEKLELYGRQQISDAYHAATEAQMRAFMMGEERDQLAAKVNAYERYRQFLRQTINVLRVAPPAATPPPHRPQRWEAHDARNSVRGQMPPLPQLSNMPPLPQAPQMAPAPSHPQPRRGQQGAPAPAYAGVGGSAATRPAPQRGPLPRVAAMEPTTRFTGQESALTEMTTYFPAEAYAGQTPVAMTTQTGETEPSPLAAMTVARLIQSQEELRQRVAQHLHDGPTQSLANLVLTAEICERIVQSDPHRALSELGHLKRMVNEALQQTRSFIFELRPMTLDDLGLAPTLRRYATELITRFEREHEIGAAPLDINVQAPDGEPRLPANIETALFRVAQEAMINAISHGAAHHVLITILATADQVKLIVDDDGQGFDVDEALAWAVIRHATGITSMQERAEMLGGWLRIQSLRGQGSRVEINAPLPANP